jgi:nucleoside-diphosphate-sugar epimerase
MVEDFDYPEKDNPGLEVYGSIKSDIRNLDYLTTAMRGCDVVVHCAAALPLYSPDDIRSIDVLGTKNVMTAAVTNGIKRVVHISSTAVYGIPDHHPLLETDKLIGVGPYGAAKIEAEKVCESFRKEGLIVPIIRPKSFVGPERLGAFALLYDWALDARNFPMIGSGENRYHLLDVQDLCEAIYLCATLADDMVNDVFNIGAEDFATMREDWQAVLDKAGFNKKIIPLPKWPIIWTLRILEALKLSPLYKWIYETAAEDSFVSIDKAKRILGWSPRYSNQDALIRNYEWYIQNQAQFKGSSGVSHRIPWKQGLLGVAKLFF